jgi:hypothetical protein
MLLILTIVTLACILPSSLAFWAFQSFKANSDPERVSNENSKNSIHPPAVRHSRMAMLHLQLLLLS